MFTVLCLVLLGRSPVTAAIVGFFVPTLLFFTCQQLGALADSIADHLSFDFSPPASDPKDKEDEESRLQVRRTTSFFSFVLVAAVVQQESRVQRDRNSARATPTPAADVQAQRPPLTDSPALPPAAG